MNEDDYEHVFINCPFDPEFEGLLYVMLFTIISLGYYPKLSLGLNDSTTARIDKIIQLINDSNYCIHDLSRIKATKKNDYFRLNMPFELGLDYGYKKFSATPNAKDRKTLILGEKEFEFAKSISDLAGMDISYHKNNAEELVKVIRNWFIGIKDIKSTPPYLIIWYKYIDFTGDFKIYATKCSCQDDQKLDIPIKEMISHMFEYIKTDPYPLNTF